MKKSTHILGRYYYNHAVKSIDNVIDVEFDNKTKMSWDEFNIKLDMYDPKVRKYFDNKYNGLAYTIVDRMLRYALCAYIWQNVDCTVVKANSIFNCIMDFITSSIFVEAIGKKFELAHNFVKMIEHHNAYSYGREAGNTQDTAAHKIITTIIQECYNNIGIYGIKTK